MYVVLDSIDNEIASLVPDSQEDMIYVPIEKIPEPYEVGDVFFVEKKHQPNMILTKDSEEKQRRVQSNYKKRQKLLNKTQNKKSD